MNNSNTTTFYIPNILQVPPIFNQDNTHILLKVE